MRRISGPRIRTGDFGGPVLTWPEGLNPRAAVRHFDLGAFSQGRHENLVNSFLVAQSRDWGFFTAFHPRFRLLFGYVFPRSQFPWFNIWENHNEQLPTRGMEFSNTPHHGTMKALISAPEIWGVPTYEWIDARSTVAKQFIAFLHPVPPDFGGTADLRLLGDVLEILERGAARTFTVPFF